MYGCELWSKITQSRSVKLEQAHIFCIKHKQHVPPYTKRTDVCLSLIGTMSLIFHIDERKLVFVGQICRLAADHVLRSIFCYRLVCVCACVRACVRARARVCNFPFFIFCLLFIYMYISSIWRNKSWNRYSFSSLKLVYLSKMSITPAIKVDPRVKLHIHIITTLASNRHHLMVHIIEHSRAGLLFDQHASSTITEKLC